MDRIKEFDTIKAISIFLVVYVHNDFGSELNIYVHSFLLSPFFITSGYVHRGTNNITLSSFICAKLKRLIVPYLLISFALYLFWYFLGRHYGASANVNYDTTKNLIGIFYAQGSNEYMNWGIPLWFIPAMFLVLMIDFFVSKLNDLKVPKFLSFVILTLLGIYLNQTLQFRLPWSLDIALIAYGFFYFGQVFKAYDLSNFFKTHRLSLGILLLIFNLLTYNINGRVDLYYAQYGKSVLLMYLNGIISFLWMYSLVSRFPNFKFLTWIGKNTLLILAFHHLSMTFIKAFALFILNTEIKFNTLNSLLFAMLQILLLSPVIMLINKHMPIMAGIGPKTHCNSNQLPPN